MKTGPFSYNAGLTANVVKHRRISSGPPAFTQLDIYNLAGDLESRWKGVKIALEKLEQREQEGGTTSCLRRGWRTANEACCLYRHIICLIYLLQLLLQYYSLYDYAKRKEFYAVTFGGGILMVQNFVQVYFVWYTDYANSDKSKNESDFIYFEDGARGLERCKGKYLDIF
eukprot:UN32129